MEERHYIQIMIESLQKKLDILSAIKEHNRQQEALLKQEDVGLDEWEGIIEKKSQCIDQLNQLDDGFGELYNRLKDELQQNKEQYKEQIAAMKQLIAQITDASVDIKAQELRNKKLAESQFSAFKKQTKSLRQNRQVASLYDATMKKLNYVDAQFWDQKQ